MPKVERERLVPAAAAAGTAEPIADVPLTPHPGQPQSNVARLIAVTKRRPDAEPAAQAERLWAGARVDCTATAAAPDLHAGPTASMCGFRIPLQGRPLFVALVAGSIASALSFAALQEGVWRIPGFKYNAWMTFVMAATLCGCGMLEKYVLTLDTRRVGTLKQYAKLSVLTLGGMYFTNWSLKYLNYPTRIIFKSSKLLPTMAVGTCLLGRWYSALEYLAAAGLVCGLVLFTLGDAETLPSFHPIGIGLILVGVVLDAATSNYEEASFFRVARPAAQAEVVAYASLFGSVWGFVLLVASGELAPCAPSHANASHVGGNSSSASNTTAADVCHNALAHAYEHPEALPYMMLSSACNYVSVSFVLLLIKMYGATVTELVKSTRKVLSVSISFLLYPKPLSWKYGVGGAFVLVSLAATQELQRRKGGDVKLAPPKRDGGGAATAAAADVEMAPSGDAVVREPDERTPWRGCSDTDGAAELAR